MKTKTHSGTASGVLIVGASVAGIRTARALRDKGFQGAVRVVDGQTEIPYDKPPLSKRAVDAEVHVPLITAAEAAELRIELILGSPAVSLDPTSAGIVLADGRRLGYDTLVIATGLTARSAPWSDDAVHVLRTADDARALRADLVDARHLLVVGAGFIGAEVASLARKHGIDVTLVDPTLIPMSRVVGDELGERMAALHRRHGVNTKFGTVVTDLTRAGTRLHAELADGSAVTTDVVLVGIGSEVNVGWLEQSLLPLADGVLCDESGRVAGFPGVFAVGDVACWHQPRLGFAARAEHWTNAVEQAICVAHKIAHPADPKTLDSVGFVWSDQHDWKIQLAGTRDVTRQPLVLEQAEPFRLAALWSDDNGRVTGGMTVNWPKASVRLRGAVANVAAVSELHGQLTSVAVPA